VTAGDDLCGIGAVQRLVVEFIERLHDIDSVGDAGRYGHDRYGNPALRLVCCADPGELRAAVVGLYDYVTGRLDVTGSVASP
jgi:hypothetical protein